MTAALEGERSRPQAVRRRIDAAIATSPPAIEATLSSISDEVMNEAIARRARLLASGVVEKK